MFKVTVTYVVHNQDGSVEIRKDHSHCEIEMVSAVIKAFPKKDILEIHIGKEKE